MSDLTAADWTTIGLHIRLAALQAVDLPTREDRVAFLTGQEFDGPHGGRVRLTRDNAEQIADIVGREIDAFRDMLARVRERRLR